MLIDVCHTQVLRIDASKYTTTLAVAVTTRDKNRKTYGVFAGRHGNIDLDNEDKTRCPVIDDLGYGQLVFVIDRPKTMATRMCAQEYNYVVLGWAEQVYIEIPYAYHLKLTEVNKGEVFWEVAIKDIRLALPDYCPGWSERTTQARLPR